jgi:hypothetical protein
MNNTSWTIGPIEKHLPNIRELFSQNEDHRLAENYLIKPLFEHTRFARMGYSDNKMIYYSAGIERPEYNGSIRIMSRHTRDRNFDFGSKQDDLNRGLQTLELSVFYAQYLGYKDIWVSRESSPNLFYWFQKNSMYEWSVGKELLHNGTNQYVMRLQNGG